MKISEIVVLNKKPFKQPTEENPFEYQPFTDNYNEIEEETEQEVNSEIDSEF